MTVLTIPSRIWIHSRQALWAATVAISLEGFVPRAEAQTAVGGHIDFVLPRVTRVGGQTTNLRGGGPARPFQSAGWWPQYESGDLRRTLRLGILNLLGLRR